MHGIFLQENGYADVVLHAPNVRPKFIPRLIFQVTKLPNEKEAVYGALDKWVAWETEFPLVAAAKALGILRKRRQWLRIIQAEYFTISNS